jgi:hypothetical protein
MTVLQVVIKRLHVGRKSYEIGNFMGDLHNVFEFSPEFPCNEVEVKSVPTPPPSNEAVRHVQSHKSDGDKHVAPSSNGPSNNPGSP